MATGLLRQGRYGGGVAEIFAAFLGADFERLLARTAAFWSDHAALTGKRRRGHYWPSKTTRIPRRTILPRTMLKPLSWQANRMWAWCHARRARSALVCSGQLVKEPLASSATACVRAMMNELEQAIDKLSGLSALATRLSSDELWILINLVEATARRFAANSLHGRVARLAARAPEQQLRMWRFAREQFARGRGVLWTSQVQGLERLIASDSCPLYADRIGKDACRQSRDREGAAPRRCATRAGAAGAVSRAIAGLGERGGSKADGRTWQRPDRDGPLRWG